LISDLCLPRSLDAHAAGLDGGVWIAVKAESRVFGILEFLGSSFAPASEELLFGLEAFGSRLGYEMARSRTQE
jgi:hypothetical protein